MTTPQGQEEATEAAEADEFMMELEAAQAAMAEQKAKREAEMGGPTLAAGQGGKGSGSYDKVTPPIVACTPCDVCA